MRYTKDRVETDQIWYKKIFDGLSNLLIKLDSDFIVTSNCKVLFQPIISHRNRMN